MQLFIVVIIAVFLSINFKILLSDIYYQIIPNKLLGILGTFGVFLAVYIFLQTTYITSGVLLNTLYALGIGFLLYYFGVWSAGDAKYIIILNLFLYEKTLLSLFFNIGIVIILYMLLNTIWFYMKQFKNESKKRIYAHIKTDIGEKIQGITLNHEKVFHRKELLVKLLGVAIVGVGFFIVFRLSRGFLIDNLREILNKLNMEKFSGEIIILGGICSIFLGKVIQKKYQTLIKKIHAFFSEKKMIQNIGTTWILISTTILIILLVGAYLLIGDISVFLVKILNILVIGGGIYIVIKFFIYLFNINTQFNDAKLIAIDSLKLGEIVDKNFLLHQFKNQLKNKEDIEFIKNFENPISLDDKNHLQKIFLQVNERNKHKKSAHPYTLIKTLNMFPFSPFIFGGFIITIIYGNTLEKIFMNIFFHSLNIFN